MSLETSRQRLFSIFGALALARGASAQRAATPTPVGGEVRVTVAVSGSDIRLANSAVELAPMAGERLTNDSGLAVFSRVPDGAYRLHVRRIGYYPRDTDVVVKDGGLARVKVELTHLAVRLAQVETRARARCDQPGIPIAAADGGPPDAASVFRQVVENAHQLRLLSTLYPFEYLIERKVSFPATDTMPGRAVVDTIQFSGAPARNYAPGRVIALASRGGAATIVLNVPTLVDFAEARFQSNHCFDYLGVVDDSERRMVRVDFWPADRIDAPDVEGTILLDTATFQVARVTMRLTHVERVPGLRDVLGTTTTSYYSEVAPAIPLLKLLISDNTLRGSPRPAGTPERHEQRVISFYFANARPAGVNGPPP